eukprot:363964-Chlamydomonas_euryale.AAC.3
MCELDAVPTMYGRNVIQRSCRLPMQLPGGCLPLLPRPCALVPLANEAPPASPSAIAAGPFLSRCPHRCSLSPVRPFLSRPLHTPAPHLPPPLVHAETCLTLRHVPLVQLAETGQVVWVHQLGARRRNNKRPSAAAPSTAAAAAWCVEWSDQHSTQLAADRRWLVSEAANDAHRAQRLVLDGNDLWGQEVWGVEGVELPIASGFLVILNAGQTPVSF